MKPIEFLDRLVDRFAVIHGTQWYKRISRWGCVSMVLVFIWILAIAIMSTTSVIAETVGTIIGFGLISAVVIIMAYKTNNTTQMF